MATEAPEKNALSVIVDTIKREPTMQKALKDSLPPHVPLEKFTAAAIAAIRNAPQLFVDCDRQSIYNAVAQAARDGLIPDGRQGALVPFNTKVKQGDKEYWIKKCQFMIMPQGIIDKLAKIGITVYAVSVYEKDPIQFWNDSTGQHVKHNYEPFSERGQRIGAFACATLRDGRTYVETMSMAEIDRVKAVSKQKTQDGRFFGPWVEWPERMEQKSALHRICKRLPSVEISEDDEFTGRQPESIVIQPEPETKKLPTPVAQSVSTSATRPRALQAVVDSETGEILNVDQGATGTEHSDIEQQGSAPF